MPDTVDDYIYSIRTQGGYSFSLDALRKQVPGSENAISLALHRAVQKNKIVSVRKGFYIILPPEYAGKGTLPVTYFIDDLMQWLDRRYYIGLYSAAAILGAGHQQPMEAYICIHKPALRTIRNNKLIINFMVKSKWDSRDIREVKTDMGYIPVSSPELTALDLLYYQHKGGVSRSLPILEDLYENMEADTLRETVDRYPFTSAVQRLGYLFDREFQLNEIVAPLERFIEQTQPNYTRLSTNHTKQGKYDPIWKIIKNISLEDEL